MVGDPQIPFTYIHSTIIISSRIYSNKENYLVKSKMNFKGFEAFFQISLQNYLSNKTWSH